MASSRGLYLYQVCDSEVGGMPWVCGTAFGSDHFIQNGTLYVLNKSGGLVAMLLLPREGHVKRLVVEVLGGSVSERIVWRSDSVRTR